MKYKAIIFDLDGTLIDSMGVWQQVDKDYLQKRGIPCPEDVFEDVQGGNSFIEICQHFKSKFNLPDSIEEIGAEWTSMVADHYENNVKMKQNAEKFLQKLEEVGIKMAVGTSNSQYLAESVLRSNGVFDKFEVIISGSEEIKGKPFPDIFLAAAKNMGVAPKNCLVIEDVLIGVQAAKNAGMDVFAISDEHSKRDRDEIIRFADFFAEDYQDIITKLF